MTKTDCYKCGISIEVLTGLVHPLCGECQESFDDWFATQVMLVS